MGDPHRFPAPLRALGLAARALSRAVDSAPWVALALATPWVVAGAAAFDLAAWVGEWPARWAERAERERVRAYWRGEGR